MVAEQNKKDAYVCDIIDPVRAYTGLLKDNPMFNPTDSFWQEELAGGLISHFLTTTLNEINYEGTLTIDKDPIPQLIDGGGPESVDEE